MTFRIDIYHHVEESSDLGFIKAGIRKLIGMETQHMLDLTALTTEVAENSDVVASAAAVVQALRDEIAANVDDPAALAALVAQLDANNAALAAAIAETPVVP